MNAVCVMLSIYAAAGMGAIAGYLICALMAVGKAADTEDDGYVRWLEREKTYSRD